MRIVIVILALLLGMGRSYGQFTFVSNNQQIVREAVEKGFFMSKQSFQICDRESGELFGLNGKKEFGIQYTIGVKVSGGYVLTDMAVRPWVYNSKFDKYKDKYDPVFYEAMYSELGGKPKYEPLDYSLTNQEELTDEALYLFSSGTFNQTGFVVDTDAGEKNGWVVWFIAKKDADFEKSVDINYTIFRQDIKVGEGQEFSDIEMPTTEQTVMGGVYVVPYYPNAGVIEFRLCGFIAKVDNSWKIICPFVGKEIAAKPADDKVTDEDVVQEDGGGELTPVGNKDKKEKSTDKKQGKK